MKNLAEEHWVKKDETQNRIAWSVSAVLEYYGPQLLKVRERELRILNADLLENPDIPEATPLYRRLDAEKPRLLDVGSCFNPFQKYSADFEAVVAIDIAPIKGSGVLKMDFSKATISDDDTELKSCHGRLRNVPRNYFDVVVFSLLLEYMPSPGQRLECARKAYEVLDNEGILLIITPDSKHVGINAKLRKNWRYTLALLGFNRIRFEKLEHVTCMVFRKAIHKQVTWRWAKMNKEDDFNEEINIPQDFNWDDEGLDDDERAADLRQYTDLKTRVDLMNELPNF